MCASGTSQTSRISYEEFLERFVDQRAEWVGRRGYIDEPCIRSTPGECQASFHIVERASRRCPLGRVFFEPFQMKVGLDLPGREPDLFFVRQDRLDGVGKAHFAGPGDLVVEVVSPESRGRDRGDKFYEYERGGVKEYWLIDPERQSAEFYIRDDAGLFQLAKPGADGVYRSAMVEGFFVRVAWFWKIPPLCEALADLGLK